MVAEWGGWTQMLVQSRAIGTPDICLKSDRSGLAYCLPGCEGIRACVVKLYCPCTAGGKVVVCELTLVVG